MTDRTAAAMSLVSPRSLLAAGARRAHVIAATRNTAIPLPRRNLDTATAVRISNALRQHRAAAAEK